jgi:hypothetical protein
MFYLEWKLYSSFLPNSLFFLLETNAAIHEILGRDEMEKIYHSGCN